jgi:hypothetical protein
MKSCHVDSSTPKLTTIAWLRSFLRYTRVCRVSTPRAPIRECRIAGVHTHDLTVVGPHIESSPIDCWLRPDRRANRVRLRNLTVLWINPQHFALQSRHEAESNSIAINATVRIAVRKH